VKKASQRKTLKTAEFVLVRCPLRTSKNWERFCENTKVKKWQWWVGFEYQSLEKSGLRKQAINVKKNQG